MLNVLRPAIARLLTPVGRALARTPVTPNALTITGTLGVSAGALVLFPTGHLFAGTLVCTGFVFTDMLDGTLARIKGTTGAWGAFLDSTLDRVADASVFAGLAAWAVYGGHSRLLAALAVFCLVTGSLISYAKARAESLGVRCDVGIAERTERLVIGLTAAGLHRARGALRHGRGTLGAGVPEHCHTGAAGACGPPGDSSGGDDGCPDSKTG